MDWAWSHSEFDLPIGCTFGRTPRCSGGLRRAKDGVAFDGHAVGVLRGAQAGGYPGFAGGDGLAVAAAIGAFGQGLG